MQCALHSATLEPGDVSAEGKMSVVISTRMVNAWYRYLVLHWRAMYILHAIVNVKNVTLKTHSLNEEFKMCRAILRDDVLT